VSDYPKVFVSSTSRDLGPFRAAIKEVALKRRFTPVMSEHFTASGLVPLEKCLSAVSDCDLVVAIVARSYGSVPKSQAEAKSYTWLECEHALDEGKDVLVFVLHEKAEWSVELTEAYRLTAAMESGEFAPELAEEVRRNMGKLAEFRTWLGRGRVRPTFETLGDLRVEVAAALDDWRQEHPEHWPEAVRAGVTGDPTRYLEDLLQDTAWIDIRGLQVGSGKAHRFPIEDLYVPLKTQQRPGEERGRRPEELRGGPGEDHEVPLDEALRQPRLAIVGDPGSGKTTFLNRIEHALCEVHLGHDPDAAASRLGMPGEAPFPIRVKLADLAEFQRRAEGSDLPATADSPEWLCRFLGTCSEEHGWKLSAGYFREQLENSPSLVLLDGLDEAPNPESRKALVSLVEKLARRFEKARVVLTTRPAAYGGETVLRDFESVRVAPFGDESIEAFFEKWCAGLFPESESRAKQHQVELQGAVQAKPEIRRMATNPVMLTALAVVHWNEKRLPDQRAELYESVLNWLAIQRPQAEGRPSPDRCLDLLQEVALAMQDEPRGRQVQVPRRWAAEKLGPEMGEADSPQAIRVAERFLEQEEVDSGIVISRGHDLRFWHLSFQEFLAARGVAARLDKVQREMLLGVPGRLFSPEWRETILLFFGVLHRHGARKVEAMLGELLGTADAASRPDRCRLAGLIDQVLLDLSPTGYRLADSRYPALLDGLMPIFTPEGAREVSIDARLPAAEAIGRAGDPRLLNDDWVPIPGGKFRFGEKKKRVAVESFEILRYPVTVAQYEPFVEEGGDEPWQWPDQLRHPSRPW
jgi:hypothetical protein